MSEFPGFPELHLTEEQILRIGNKVLAELGYTIPPPKPAEARAPKSSDRWFWTIAKQGGIDESTYVSKFKQCRKKKNVKRAMGCIEHHKSGDKHMHFIVETCKPVALSEIKRIFNFEKTMKPPAYYIKPFNQWDNMMPYITKEEYHIITE